MKLIEFYRKTYLSVLIEATTVEQTWLWLQIKNKNGFSSIVQPRDETITHGMSPVEINKRYNSMMHEHVISGNNEFNQGIEQVENISIQGVDQNTSLLAMKSVYINSELSIRQRGALYQKIKDKIATEHNAHVLRLTSKINEIFQHQGSVDSRLAPQDFYLPLMGDRSDGRCYPLVRAMAVALAKNGQKGANTLLDKLFLAAALPHHDSTKILKEALKNLHSNIYATQASDSLGILNLDEIKTELESGNPEKIYAINTTTHAMLLGKKVNNKSTYYYFIDPNFGIFTFNDINKLFSSLNEIMIENHMGAIYLALGSTLKPTFELISINTSEMANVPIGAGLTVTDLSNETDLNHVNDFRRYVSKFIYDKANITKDLQIRTSLNILKTEQWKARISHAYDELIQSNELDGKWVANFSDIETLQDGKYRIQFIHKEDELNTCWIETSDKTFIEFQRYFSDCMRDFQKSHSFNNSKLQRNVDLSEIENINGMNAGVVFYTLLQENSNDRYVMDNGVSSNLNTALKIHSYINYMTMVQGEINDSAKIFKLVHTLWRESAEIEKIRLEKFSFSLMRAANASFNVVFHNTLIGVDIYELANAQNEAQKSIFGTQLAFDSFNSFEYSLSMIGAESVADVAEPLFVPIFGIGIGIIELVKINALHAEEAAQVGVYFEHLKNGYQNAKLDYDPEKKLILPMDYIVYKKIDFRKGYFELDSQYIYRSRYGLNGSGSNDYISIIGLNPSSKIDKNEAINIREAVGVNANIISFNPARTDTTVLPIVPKSYIDYEYNSLAFSSYRNDTGFDVLRDIEEKYRFDFDFFHGVYHKIITKLKYEYVYTTIVIILDEKNRHLVVPNIPDAWRNQLLHVVTGYGGEYRININYGATLMLKEDVDNGKISKWIVDASFINSSCIYLYDKRLSIDSMSVYFDGLSKKSQLFIVNSESELYKVDFIEHKLIMISTDASQWKGGVIAEQYFSSIKRKNQLNNEFIIIHNYIYNGRNVGMAYYEVANNRIIFTNSSGEEFHSSILGAVDEQSAYFYSPNNTMIWRVNIENGNLIIIYNSFIIRNSISKVIDLWKENESILIKMSHQKNDLEVIFSKYKIIGYQLELLSVSNNTELLDKIAITNTTDVGNEIQSMHALFGIESSSLLVASCIPQDACISNAKLVIIDGKDSEGINRRYWLHTDSKTLIKPNLEASFYTHVEHGNIIQWTPPNDLILVGSLFSNSGAEVFFFYSQYEGKIYRQEGLGQNILENGNSTAKIIQGLNDIKNVTESHGNIIIVNKQNEIKQLSSDGSTQLVGVNNKWLDNKEENLFWWSRLDTKYKEVKSLITLLSLKNGDRKVPAWYFKGKIIIAHTLSASHELEFLGSDPENKGAYIFDITIGQLFYQEAADAASIINSMGEPPSVIQRENFLPKIMPIYENLQFKNVKNIGQGLFMITKNDEIIYDSMVKNNQDNKLGSSLVIKGTQYDDTIIPTKVEDVKCIILSGGEGSDIYRIKLDDWMQYKTIIIDNYSKNKEIDQVIFPIKDCFDDLLIEKIDDDIFISDIVNDTLVIFNKVYGSESESYRHFKIKIEGYSFYLDIETIIDCLDGQDLPMSFYMIRNENNPISVDLHLNSTSAQQSNVNLDSATRVERGTGVNLIRRPSDNTNLLRERMSLMYDYKSINVSHDDMNIQDTTMNFIMGNAPIY